MEDFLKYKTIRIEQALDDGKSKSLLRTFNDKKGVESAKCNGQFFTIIYDPYEISEGEIVQTLANLGLSPKKPARNFFKRKLEKLAESNRKNLGNSRLDCCGLYD